MDIATDVTGLQGVRDDITRAHGLPNRFYTDPGIFEEEKYKIFESSWSCIGFGSDVPEPGCVMPIEFLGTPLLAVRGSDKQLRVFQNVCRHRGMILVSEKTKLSKLIRCPYHSWSYDFTGALRATPHVGGPDNHSHPAICKQELGLIEVRAYEFLGAIFVNLDGDAKPFEEYAQTLLQRWRAFDLPLYSGGSLGSVSMDVACNWKLAVENYCESYHLPFIHPGLNSYSKLEDHYHIEQPGEFSGQGSRVYSPGLSRDGRRLPDFADLGDEWDKKAEYISFFPNVLLGVHRDHTFAMLLQPINCGHTLERLEIFYAEDVKHDEHAQELLVKNRDLWRQVFSEDVSVVEGMQRGRHCDGFDGGKFSPVMDGPTHVFHNWVAERFV